MCKSLFYFVFFLVTSNPLLTLYFCLVSLVSLLFLVEGVPRRTPFTTQGLFKNERKLETFLKNERKIKAFR